ELSGALPYGMGDGETAIAGREIDPVALTNVLGELSRQLAGEPLEVTRELLAHSAPLSRPPRALRRAARAPRGRRTLRAEARHRPRRPTASGARIPPWAG